MSRPTKQADMSMKHFQDDAVTNVAVDVMTDKGNFYGFYVENEDTADIYLQMFDAAASAVTVGSTVPDFTYKIPASTVLGKDPQEFPMDFFVNALSIAVTTTRTGGAAPGAVASVHIWHSNK